MAWFRHHYYCEGCEGNWLAEAELPVETELAIETDVTIEADCPHCGARGVFPYKSEDRTLAAVSGQKKVRPPKATRRLKVRPSRAA